MVETWISPLFIVRLQHRRCACHNRALDTTEVMTSREQPSAVGVQTVLSPIVGYKPIDKESLEDVNENRHRTERGNNSYLEGERPKMAVRAILGRDAKAGRAEASKGQPKLERAKGHCISHFGISVSSMWIGKLATWNEWQVVSARCQLTGDNILQKLRLETC